MAVTALMNRRTSWLGRSRSRVPARHQHRRQERLAATQDLYALARDLWERLDEVRPIRFMAIGLTELSPAAVSQLDLFEAGQPRSERVSALQDRLRDRFGERAVVSGRCSTGATSCRTASRSGSCHRSALGARSPTAIDALRPAV